LQTYYTLRCPRTLEITTLHHAGKEGNIENDYEERRREDGTRLARVEYEYVRDAYDNWTKRVIRVWDAKTNKMIAVEEDQRIISYFGEGKRHSQGEEKPGTP
jgi:ABC-type sulfate transport system substrate-binding protein